MQIQRLWDNSCIGEHYGKIDQYDYYGKITLKFPVFEGKDATADENLIVGGEVKVFGEEVTYRVVGIRKIRNSTSRNTLLLLVDEKSTQKHVLSVSIMDLVQIVTVQANWDEEKRKGKYTEEKNYVDTKKKVEHEKKLLTKQQEKQEYINSPKMIQRINMEANNDSKINSTSAQISQMEMTFQTYFTKSEQKMDKMIDLLQESTSNYKKILDSYHDMLASAIKTKFSWYSLTSMVFKYLQFQIEFISNLDFLFFSFSHLNTLYIDDGQ